MNIDPDICYRAVKSRDRRFDGRFFTAVTSTGIYCRPICPAPTPRRENCSFYACASAAEEAGFRPCLRCRPEASPGTPAWQGTSATVSRALKLIGAGALDSYGVERLAGRLGIGERHLRRLFVEHLGASPVAVAQTRRLHFAKKLIDETSLPMARIALSAGFGSVRRFNAAFQNTYGKSPTQLRRAAGLHELHDGSRLTLRLSYRPPFSWQSVAAFLGPRATPGVETIDRACYRRTVAFADLRGVIEIRPLGEKGQLLLTAPVVFSEHLAGIVAKARDLFDLGADPLAINRHLTRDPFLTYLVQTRPGLRVPGAWDRFELAVRAVLGQQISVAGATTLAGRLVRTFGEELPDNGDGELRWIFPTPERLADADVARIGLPKTRADTVRQLARFVRDGELDLEPLADLDRTVQRIAGLPGIGDWTAQYIAMRAMGEPDAFPASDLGLRRALADGDRPSSSARVLKRAETWRPWRAYAAMHLWLSL